MLSKRTAAHIFSIAWLILWAAGGPAKARADDRGENISKAIPDVLVYVDTDMEYKAEPIRAIIVDKARQQVRLYSHAGQWRSTARWPCSTGKQLGPKEREGDQKTPVGVYFAVKEVGQKFLSDTYGTRALPLDYPNELDRINVRSGSAIWVHGTDKPLQPWDSNGCVVLENHVIDQLASYIQLNRTPVIIVERAHLWSKKKARSMARRLLSTAQRWNGAMLHGTYQEFCSYYTEGAKPSMKWWQRWTRHRRKQGAGDAFESLMRQRTIYRSGRHYILLFDHFLKKRGHEEWAGYRKLYFSVEEDRISILADTFQAAPKTGQNPFFHAWRKLWKKNKQRSKIAVTLNGEKNS